eukprot:CAMPEP_0119302616 /NCGR_PEP_ID=MMETSP1333-20130426/4187_1 /TAXON_ID=418940 /ORGANISM="Scyphosphaera apsteinii, Strain RCC1455" /LENGTH=35 /DNA_ID= /DNA_START= /DNA_END= /DNA_ORIENTATION=
MSGEFCAEELSCQTHATSPPWREPRGSDPQGGDRR